MNTVQESESLDQYIQTALAALYPPFTSTSPTVLHQVLSVVDSCYRGDGLRYLLHFLLPAKQLLGELQQDACERCCGLLSRLEGWPLCLQEKVVVQLCRLDLGLLRPGDFYLQVSPPAAPAPAAAPPAAPGAPRLLLCSLSACGRHEEQQEVSPVALRSLFSMAWLDSVNREREQRGAARLERCLLSSQEDVFRLPWEDLVYPQLLSRPRASLKEDQELLLKDLPSALTDQSQAGSQGEESEGEYVELEEVEEVPRFSPQKGSLTQSISLQLRARTSRTDCSSPPEEASPQPRLTRAPPSTSSAPPPAVHASSWQRGTLQEQRGGAYSASLKFNTAAATCTEEEELEEQEEELEEEQEEEQEEVVGEKEKFKRVNEGEEKEEDRGEDSVLHTHTAEENGQEEHEEEQEETDGEEELKQDEEVEVEEEVQVIVVLQSQERRNEEEQVMNGEEREQTKVHEKEDASYSENTQEVHSEDSYSENTQEAHSKDSYSENTQETHFEDSYSENTQETHFEDSYSENTQEVHSKDSYCENTQETHSQDSYSENTQEVHSKDSYSENTQEAHSKDSYSENTQVVHSEDSYSENTQETHFEDSYCENTQETHSKDSYSEKTQEANSKDSYSENTQEAHSKDSYSENTQEANSKDSYSENTQETHFEDSYCEKQSGDSYCEKQSGDSYCEKQSGDSYCEKHGVDSYCEKRKCCEEDLTGAGMDPDSFQTGPRSGPVQEEQEEQEVGGGGGGEGGGGGRGGGQGGGGEGGEGGAADLNSEGLNPELLPVNTKSSGLSPAKPEPAASPNLDQTPQTHQTHQTPQTHQNHQSSFFSVLLNSGALCLPGTRDRGGRPLVTVFTSSSVWSDPDCDSVVLLRLLLYYTSTLRKELRASGLTVLVDARRAAPVPALFSALRMLQENSPGSVHTVALLLNKDSPPPVDKPAAAQVQVLVLSSVKSLQKLVDLQQLPAEVGGHVSFSQRSWIRFRSSLERLSVQCEDVIQLLQETVSILQTPPPPAAAQDAELLQSRYRAVMSDVLGDSRLVQLQQEGGACLSWLRREEAVVGVAEDGRAAVAAVEAQYERVDELLHQLVTLSNARTQELSFILDFRSLEAGFTEVLSWLQEVGEERLRILDQPEDSLELLCRKQQDFRDFHRTADERCRRGEELLSRLDRWSHVTLDDLQPYQVKVRSFWAQLQDFSVRAKTVGQRIDSAVRLYRFLDQAYGWALAGMRHLAGVSMEECSLPEKCRAVIGCLEDYQRQHPPIPDAHFQDMKVLAEEVRGERGVAQWGFAWSKCQETQRMLDRKLEAALRTRDSAHRQRSDSALSRGSRRSLSGLWGFHGSSSSVSSSVSSSCPPAEEEEPASPPPASPRHTPLLQRLFRSISSSEEVSERAEACSSSSSRRQQLRKAQSFDCPPTPEAVRYGPCPRALSEPGRHGNTGVFIRGLEVSSSEAADRTLCPRTPARSWAGPRSPGPPRTPGSPAAEPRPRGSRLRHVVEEMVTTEREYVRSLRYVLVHYFPEMERLDLPQDLRGQRSLVFGNLEKLLDFHSQFFLRELEACWKHPLRVPHCFLRHQEQFGLYALYSKNKPKSDALLAAHGNGFFRRKQVELGDKMDLSSYLLKPVQRMSKYALLLADLMKEVGVAQEAELAALQAATNMVKFQLRHGNDLLAMDAIRDCDVNLKEQGQLIRQEEFTVWSGRRRSQRHVFLFEELLLFSKPKRVEGGLDVFIYKHSFKTADVGLTESAGDDGLRFEIWFRRRTAKNQTFVLQAPGADAKRAWTADIARILWTQATRNKEMRLKEMVSMGVGSKPFLDIQPSEAAISDRAVHFMKSRGARTRASIAVSVLDQSNPFKRGAVTSDPAGPSQTSSSSSLLGPLNLHVFSPSSASSDASFIASCVEEDEQEQDTSSQPSMTTDSSGSSSRCVSGSTGSDSGCVSSHLLLQEALADRPSSTSSSSASRDQLTDRKSPLSTVV